MEVAPTLAALVSESGKYFALSMRIPGSSEIGAIGAIGFNILKSGNRRAR
jgi:hypothetical protein